MSWVFALTGLVVIAVTLFDTVQTTLTLNNGGPVTRTLSQCVWLCLRKLPHSRYTSPLKRSVGPVTLLLLLVSWFVMLWIGWTLVFMCDMAFIVRTSDQAPASFGDTLFYSGYTITTIGYGNIQALNMPARLGSVAAGLTGLMLLTLVVTYATQVLSAVIEKRRLAVLLSAMGMEEGSPRADTRSRLQKLRYLADQVGTVNPDIAGLSQKYLAYPVLHAFQVHPSQPDLPAVIEKFCRHVEHNATIFHDLPYGARENLTTATELTRVLMANAISGYGNALVLDRSVVKGIGGLDRRRRFADQDFDTLLALYVRSST